MDSMKTRYDYKKPATIMSDLVGVECWNFTTRETFTIPTGTSLEAEHAYDATHTTCMVLGPNGSHPGIPLPTSELPERIGYRFIVRNADLSKATGLRLPKRTRDIIGEIIAFESMELAPTKAKRLIRGLRRNGTLPGLQGSYGRAAAAMGV
jgi:hypothetical protein